MAILKWAVMLALLVLLIVAAFILLWLGLSVLDVGLVPPFMQPGQPWYAYELPGKWLAIPAVILGVAVWMVLVRMTGGLGVVSIEEGPPEPD